VTVWALGALRRFGPAVRSRRGGKQARLAPARFQAGAVVVSARMDDFGASNPLAP